ncbi:MAG: SGNH/GDSL hydrolase family protein [Flavobacteriales bacterium]|nr:SGNH/GDSL hydrolase family protein [Flavobacteriales bacterium]
MKNWSGKIYLVVLCLLSCGTSLLIIGCSMVKPEGKTATFLALGDSYTIGESVKESKRWPVQLVDRLNEKGKGFGKPTIIAKTGWRTDDLLKGIKDELTNEKFDLVAVLIGVNNEYQGRNTEEYKKDLRIIFEQAISFSHKGKKRVFVVSIPDYGYTPSSESHKEAISVRIDLFNRTCRKVADEYGLPLYNITPISRTGLAKTNLVAEDGLHPSDEQYQLWVDFFIDDVLALLQ